MYDTVMRHWQWISATRKSDYSMRGQIRPVRCLGAEPRARSLPFEMNRIASPEKLKESVQCSAVQGRKHRSPSLA